MNATLQWFAKAFLCLIATGVTITLGALAGSTAFAQSFEYQYGDICNERGYGGVQPVSPGGYIACGSGQSGFFGCSNAGTHSYVVRTDDNGARTWEFMYTLGAYDSAVDVRECANGDFIVVGSVRSGFGSLCKTHDDIYLMRLDPAGTVLWVHTYGSLGAAEVGYSVQEATLSAGTGTAAGDFLIAGYTHPLDDTTTGKGYLIRTDASGIRIWDRLYSIPKRDRAAFYSVVEAKVNNSADVIAAGFARNGTNDDAWVVRVDGNNGGFTNPGHGSMVWGPPGIGQQAAHVIELQQGPDAGDIVFVGSHYAPFGHPLSRALAVVRIDPDPDNGVLVDRIGLPTTPGQYAGLQPTWIHEVTATGTGFNAGDLVIAGTYYLDTSATPVTRAFITGVVPGTLAYNGTGIKRYGGNVITRGFSVYDVAANATRSAGFILAGTYSPSTDQLYLVKTDPNLFTNCGYDSIPINGGQPHHPWSSVSPEIDSVDTMCTLEPSPEEVKTASEICFEEAQSLQKLNGSSLTLTMSDLESEKMLAIYPNPLKRGATLKLDLASTVPGAANVTITDITGAVVFSGPMGHGTALSLGTEHWATGNYIVQVSGGNTHVTRRIVVTE